MPVKHPTTTEKKVAKAFHEVHTRTPEPVKKGGLKGEAREKQLVAVALSKARAAGADIPDKPSKPRKSSKASY
jgi:hypothetical protein